MPGPRRRYLWLAWLLLPLLVAALLLIIIYRRRQPVLPPAPVVAGAVKILVTETGFYRVSLDDLQDAGLGGPLTEETVYLGQAGLDVPYLLAEDGLIFYGQAPSSRYTAFRPYILQTGRPGTVMTTTSAPPLTESAAGRIISQTVRLEENHIYDSRARDPGNAEGGHEPWFWQTIQVQSELPLAFSLPEVSEAAAVIRLSFWGASHNPNIENDHDLDLLLNGQNLGTIRWDGESRYTAELTIPAGVLQPGENNLSLDNRPEGATLVDITRLDWLEIVYTAPAEAIADYLAFSNEAGVTLTGFSSHPYLFDVSDPAAPIQLTGWEYEGSEMRLAAMPGRQLVAVGPDGLRRPQVEASLRQSAWKDTGRQADLIIITTDELAPALAPLVTARQEQGLAVALVPAAEIYDEFGNGEISPDAILTLVRYAYDNWAEPKPRYLLLVGDTTYDYRGYTNDSSANLIPSFLIPVEYSGETISDTRFGDVTGDAQPELAVGRWPVSQAAEVSRLVERTLAYEQGETTAQALFSADGTSAEFSSLTDSIIEESGFPAEQVAKLYGVPAGQLVQQWAEGAWLVAYTGHGSLDRWGKEDVFSLEAVPQIRSAGSPPIVVQFTCLTGFFAHPETISLSEAMLNHEDGPVLLVAATSLTLSANQKPFAVALLTALQDPTVERMGDALQLAKLSLDVAGNNNLREVSDTFGLLGDPSTIIQRP